MQEEKTCHNHAFASGREMGMEKKQHITHNCPRLACAAEMRELERRAIAELGIPGMVLMENAGRATVDCMEMAYGPLAGKSVCVWVGPGNNGGDGLVIARTAQSRGAFPLIMLLADPEVFPPDAASNWHIVKQLKIPCLFPAGAQNADHEKIQAQMEEHIKLYPLHCLVDALFGIGLTRPVEGIFHKAIAQMQNCAQRYNRPLVSADMPSGINSDTGQVMGTAVRADLCVSYGLAKPGHYHHGGEHIGKLHLVDIGIPAQLVQAAALPGKVLNNSLIHALPRRSFSSHKGTHGHVLTIAGSLGKSGAAILSARAALRSGAGLVTCVVPHKLTSFFAMAQPELMYEPLPASAKWFSSQDLDTIMALCVDKNAIVLGPGLGTEADTVQLVQNLYLHVHQSMVVDADALNILALDTSILSKPGGPRIFTPHPGEMSRLLKLTIAEIQTDRLTAARKLCTLASGSIHPITVILKGAGTVVAARDTGWAINASGNAGMGTGGMGDVLSGLLAGLLAQDYDLWSAACAGVYLHGAAADLLAKTVPYGYTASELADTLPKVLT